MLKQIGFYKLYIALFLVLIVSIFVSYPLITFLELALAGYLFASSVRRSFFTTAVSSTVFGMAGVLAMASLLLALLWLLHISLPLRLILWITIVACSLYTLGRRNARPKHIVDYKDLVAGFIVIVYICITFLGIYRTDARSHSFSIKTAGIQSVTNGIDDLSHLMMYQTTIKADQGLLLGSQDAPQEPKQISASYPKMSHTLAALLYSGPRNPANKINLVLAYALTQAIVFAAVIYIVCRASLEPFKNRGSRLAISLAAIPMLLAVTLLFTQVFVEEGFFSIWPILIYTPLLLLIFSEYTSLSFVSALLVGGMTTAIMTSWTIMGLPIYAAIVVCVWANFRSWKWRNLAALATALLGLIQLGAQFLDKSNGISQSDINAPGGIPFFPIALIVLIGIGTVIAVLYRSKRDKNLFLFTYVCAAVGFSVLIGYLNLWDTNSLQYFYMKTSILLCIIFSAIFVEPYVLGFVTLVRKQLDSGKYVTNASIFLLSSLAILLAVLGLGAQQNALYSGSYLLRGSRHVSAVTASYLVHLGPGGTSGLVVADVDTRLENYYTNALLGGLDEFNKCQVSAQTFGINPSTQAAVQSLQAGCSPQSIHKFLIVDNPAVANQISCSDVRTLVNSVSAASKVEFVGSNECGI